MLYRVYLAMIGLKLATLVVIGTDCTGRMKIRAVIHVYVHMERIIRFPQPIKLLLYNYPIKHYESQIFHVAHIIFQLFVGNCPCSHLY